MWSHESRNYANSLWVMIFGTLVTLPHMDAIVEATMPQQRDCHFSQFCRGLTWSLIKNLIPFFSHPADKWMFISKYAISWLFITHILSSPYHLHIWLTWP